MLQDACQYAAKSPDLVPYSGNASPLRQVLAALPVTETAPIHSLRSCSNGLQELAWQLHGYRQDTNETMTDMKIQPFAHHEQALKIRELRNQVLSSNIANADTPNYKARDVDFSTALKGAQGGQLSMTKTSDLHKSSWSTNRLGLNVQYRNPIQPTLDGNTVETDVEQAAFAENAVQYRATLRFLDGTIRSLRYALKGGD